MKLIDKYGNLICNPTDKMVVDKLAKFYVKEAKQKGLDWF